jgi:hypothetical protein
MDAIPTRRGQPRRTRDMADIYACICGSVVADDQRVMGSNTALRCGFDGCETSWVCLPTFYVGSFLILAATDNSFIWNASILKLHRRGGAARITPARENVHAWLRICPTSSALSTDL